MSDLDLGPPLRTAIIEDDGAVFDGKTFAETLAAWENEPAVFTRRPVPASAKYPLCVVNPPRAINDIDGLTSRRPVVLLDLAFYGRKSEPGSADDQTRIVEAQGRRAYVLFHRQKFSVQIEGFSVIDIVASGPFAGPVDDEGTVARIVTLRMRLGRNS